MCHFSFVFCLICLPSANAFHPRVCGLQPLQPSGLQQPPTGRELRRLQQGNEYYEGIKQYSGAKGEQNKILKTQIKTCREGGGIRYHVNISFSGERRDGSRSATWVKLGGIVCIVWLAALKKKIKLPLLRLQLSKVISSRHQNSANWHVRKSCRFQISFWLENFLMMVDGRKSVTMTICLLKNRRRFLRLLKCPTLSTMTDEF